MICGSVAAGVWKAFGERLRKSNEHFGSENYGLWVRY